MTRNEPSPEEAKKAIANKATLSEFLKQPRALELLQYLSDSDLERFTDALTDIEISKIWDAVSNMNSWQANDIFISELFQRSSPYQGRSYLLVCRALIANDRMRYITWFKEWARLSAPPYNDRISTRFSSIDELALKEILNKADAKDVNDLSQWILSEAPPQSKIKFLNVLAQVGTPSAGPHPLLELKEFNENALFRVLSTWWDAERDRCLVRAHGKSWRELFGFSYHYTCPESISFLAEHSGKFLTLPIGYIAGVLAEVPDSIESVLRQYGVDVNVTAFLPMAQMWHYLSKISDYRMVGRGEHEIELLGLRQALLTKVTEHPECWTQSLRWIMLHAEVRGIKSDVVAVTCQLNELAIPHLRLLIADGDGAIAALARGILALLNGMNDPCNANISYLSDSLAHYHDGTPKFPSPLSLRSGTWICSGHLEQYFRDGVKRATAYFDCYLPDSHGSPEESLTSTLMSELINQFRISENMLERIKPESIGVPKLKLAQRDVSKTKEEPIYGCDLAFTVKAHAPGVYLMEWVELVQVKKSLAMSNSNATRRTADSWELDIVQLKKIISYSSSAAYFLLCAQGGTLVVPARYLLGFVGVKVGFEGSKTRTLGYNDVRSAAIPLEQYLIDLLIGQWVGTNSKETLSFVNGNEKHKPRAVFEVAIEFASPNH